jgi:hypothetical protein
VINILSLIMNLAVRVKIALGIGTLAFLPLMIKAWEGSDIDKVAWYAEWQSVLILPLVFAALGVFAALIFGWLVSKSEFLRSFWQPDGRAPKILFTIGLCGVIVLSTAPDNLPAFVEWIRLLFIPCWFGLVVSIAGWHAQLLNASSSEKFPQ